MSDKKQAQNKEYLNKRIDEAVSLAAQRAYDAGLIHGRSQAKNYYQQTETKLRAYPRLQSNIERYQAEIAELLEHGTTSSPRGGRSKDISKFDIFAGTRLTDEQITAGLIADCRRKFARDQQVINEVETALKGIDNDEYKNVIYLRYFDDKKPEEIAEIICCDPSTVKRNNARLVRQMAVSIFGADAL